MILKLIMISLIIVNVLKYLNILIIVGEKGIRFGGLALAKKSCRRYGLSESGDEI
ncbi:MAG: hypothetical protein IJH65_07375 [Methanobrevibacter sp.]|nr:hypothetical protein [Methanobrevibacter sp.]